MLTEKQITEFEELIPTIENSVYKEIVTEAVENWKKTEASPRQGVFGSYMFDKDIFEEHPDIGCCLIGAYNLGKSYTKQGYVPILGKISHKEYNVIVNVFDNKPLYLDDTEYSELNELITKVRKIAIGK